MKKTGLNTFTGFAMLSGFCFTILCASCNSNNAGSGTASPDLTGNKKGADSGQITLKVEQLTNGLEAPTVLTFPGNGDIWVAEQNGKIRILREGKLTDTPLLNLKTKIVKLNTSYEERGLLGIALHPDFKTNNKIYVFYSTPSTQKNSNHTGILAEYLVPATGQIDPESGRIILTIEEPDGNHNGGCIQFGPDGYLYLGFGDGGGQGDKHGEFGNGQNMNTWLGKFLRIDINTASGYTVPKDNPFVDRKDVKPEIWAYGFRNPYRFSFDKNSGELFAGDVGQDLWEEIDIIKKGGNYGWRLLEGTHCYNPAENCDTAGIIMPITEYSHKVGVSVMAGYIYTGQQLPVLKNQYVFADWTGPVFCLKKEGNEWIRSSIKLENYPANAKITGLGQDEQGEIYLMTNPETGPGNSRGCVYKIVSN